MFPRKKKYRLIGCALLICGACMPTAWASESNPEQEQSAADALLEFIGLSAQIRRTGDAIANEVATALAQCEQYSHDPQQTEKFVRELYSPDSLQKFARQQFEQNLSAEETETLIRWINSPTGKKVYAAESALNEINEELTKQMELELVDSKEWTEDRQRIIYRVIRITRVHHYVAALNTALSAAVAMGSTCKTDFGTLNGIEIQQQRDRADEKLVAGFMLNSFIVPTGVILQPLSDEELQEYFLFSATDAAKKWYALVIDTARAMVVDRIPQVRSYLATESN